MANLNDSWREAYRRRADYLVAASNVETARAKARSAEKNSADLANAAFRESLKNGAVTVNNPVESDDLDERIKNGGWSGFTASVEKASQEPVVKGIIDALSIGNYTAAAVANSQVEAARAAKDRGAGGYIEESANQFFNHNPLVMGVKAAFGDDDSKRTFGDVIKNVQSTSGIDTESKEYQLVQGIGGFIGDVALDPSTYLTLGAGAFGKGAVTGLREGTQVAK